MRMRVGWAVLAAVLMDRENTLGASRGAAESLLDGVPQDPFQKESIEPQGALRRAEPTNAQTTPPRGPPHAGAPPLRHLACPAAAPCALILVTEHLEA